jgi:glycosyltransferase involved in cell wall biosynthesis
MKATVIIPTFDHEETLYYSIPSVLGQTVEDIEIFVIGDGVADRTRQIVRYFVAKDKRVRFFDYPKDERLGEKYRHEVLQKAKGEIVCYLADDDLWFPDHIEHISALLQKGNFCHTYVSRIDTDGTMITTLIDISLPVFRELLLNGVSFIPLSYAAHTLSFYKKLPYGWRTAPKGIYTDLYMWQQVLSHPDCKPVSGFVPTVLSFPSPARKGWSLSRRTQELDLWAKKLGKPSFCDEFRSEFYAKVIKDQALANATVEKMKTTLTWKLHNRLMNSSFGTIWRKIRGK